MNCPTNSAPGLVPTGKIVGDWSLKKPLPSPWKHPNVVRAAIDDHQVGDAVARTSATAVETGPTPAWRQRSLFKGETIAHLHVEQNRNVVGSLVGDDQIGPAVAGEVGDRDADRVGAGEEAVTAVERRTESAVPKAGVNQNVIAAAVGDDQVEDPVVVEVRQLDRAGRYQPGGCISQNGRDAADGLNDELIGELIGEDKRGRRVSVGS